MVRSIGEEFEIHKRWSSVRFIFSPIFFLGVEVFLLSFLTIPSCMCLFFHWPWLIDAIIKFNYRLFKCYWLPVTSWIQRSQMMLKLRAILWDQKLRLWTLHKWVVPSFLVIKLSRGHLVLNLQSSTMYPMHHFILGFECVLFSDWSTTRKSLFRLGPCEWCSICLW